MRVASFSLVKLNLVVAEETREKENRSLERGQRTRKKKAGKKEETKTRKREIAQRGQAEEEEEYNCLQAEERRAEGTTRKSGRLWVDQSACGEETVTAGPQAACMPEKVQCPLSEA